jgi:uncharacterized alpha-E superfamily protein
VRVIRSLLGSSIEVDGYSRLGADSRQKLVDLLVRWGALPVAAAQDAVPQLGGRAFREQQLSGGVAALVGAIRKIGRSLRDRMSADFWRVANQPIPKLDGNSTQSVLWAANVMIDRFSMLSGLAAENMGRGPAWQFYDLGRRLERALALCRITRQLTAPGYGADELGLLLDLFDSQITYRSRYLVEPLRGPVVDLLLLDPGNPRALVYQVERMAEHLASLPALHDDGVPEEPWRRFSAVLALLRGLDAAGMDETQILDIEQRLLGLSDAISQRYFLQFERSDPPISETLIV